MGLKKKAPSIEDMNAALGQNHLRPEDVQHGVLGLHRSAATAVSPHDASSGQEGPQRWAENVHYSFDSKSGQEMSRVANQSPKMTRSAPSVDRPAPASPSEGDLWKQGRDLILSEVESSATVNQESLERIVAAMRQILSPHGGSQNCMVCNSIQDLEVSGELDEDRLKHNFDAATQSERRNIIKNHSPPPDPRMRISLGRTSIEKVDFILEECGGWSGIRLQGFRRYNKALESATRWPPLSSSLDSPDLLGASRPAAPEPSDQSTSSSSALIELERSLDAAPEEELREDYRQSVKDDCVFVPLHQGRHCFAREVTERVDVEVIKLWLSRCERKHSICSQLDLESYPPGLILIDAEKMCLAPVAPDNPVRYIALSYVWGNIAQPILTKAVLEEWSSHGQLRDVDIPQTVRDAIQLVHLIGYRYAWVDALCIVQDDAASRHEQISQMHEIYRHADMTIVAADGDNCSEGLTGVTGANDRVHNHRRYDLPGLCLLSVPSSTRWRVKMSPWGTRGWTFQEELCSRRTLVFLPDVMLFSCASAVWREDLQLEVVNDLPRLDGALLTSLASMLHGKNATDSQNLVWLFRSLVGDYMKRTLSRTDDMENAFAGVAGILEPFMGPAYHGIPERMFADVIQGCWFWQTSRQRRKGFPSWSWTGWIYRREHDYISIQPLVSGTYTSNLLKFYKVGDTGTEGLGRSVLAGYSSDEFLPRMDSELRRHFIPNEEDIESKSESLQHGGGFMSGVIAFYTSVAHLRLRDPTRDFVDEWLEYGVCHPHTNWQITSIRLNVSYVAENGTLLPFMVIAHDPGRRTFRLMLISRGRDTVERVNVTTPGRFVKETDWRDADPKRELLFMS